jgi:hypothetical protein
MQHGIVEGDSVFTEPVRRIARGVGRIFGRKPASDKPDTMFGSDATMDELPKFPERPDHIPPAPAAEPETDSAEETSDEV